MWTNVSSRRWSNMVISNDLCTKVSSVMVTDHLLLVPLHGAIVRQNYGWNPQIPGCHVAIRMLSVSLLFVSQYSHPQISIIYCIRNIFLPFPRRLQYDTMSRNSLKIRLILVRCKPSTFTPYLTLQLSSIRVDAYTPSSLVKLRCLSMLSNVLGVELLLQYDIQLIPATQWPRL